MPHLSLSHLLLTLSLLVSATLGAEAREWQVLTREGETRLDSWSLLVTHEKPVFLEAVPLVFQAPAEEVLRDVGGNVYLGRMEAFENNVVVFASPVAGSVRLPASEIISWTRTHVVFSSMDESSVFLANGDVVPGEFGSLNAAGITIETFFGPMEIEWKDVRGFFLSRKERVPGEAALVRLGDGHVFHLPIAGLKPEGLVLRHPIAREISISADKIAQIVFPGFRTEPIQNAESEKPFGMGRNADGNPLRIDWRWFRTGFGVRGKTDLRIPIGPEDLWLGVWAGIDEEFRHIGNMEFFVIVNGESRWSSTRTGRNPPERIFVNVSNVSEVVLRTEGDGIGNHGVWGEPFLVR